jgi:hypothetical protein
MSEFLSAEYWNNRYLNDLFGWDLGQVSPPIKEYIDGISERDVKILIPGCGAGYEGEYLFKNGFTNVHLLDFAPQSLSKFKFRNPDFSLTNLHVGDFFLHEGKYDLIFEQTLFCAIDPTLRAAYAEKVSSLLNSGGKLVGLLFDRDFEGGPPFGGSKSEYMGIFKPFFSVVSMEPCYNSIGPRAGTELFIQLTK